ncbi:hypothetical protein HKD37_12G032897 [Glycine soja]
MQKQEVRGEERRERVMKRQRKEKEKEIREKKREDLRNINEKEGKEKEENPPPLLALNHVSRLCRNVKVSLDFYTKVLGFVLIERPQALDFEGAWLFNYGVGIHLVQFKQEDQNLPSDTEHLDPQDNHISFQRESGSNGEKVEGEGSEMDQIFFDDPDGFMVEICYCENMKLAPSDSLSKIKLPMDRHTPPVETNQNNLA